MSVDGPLPARAERRKETPAERRRRVARLYAQVRRGTYRPDPDALAERLVRVLFEAPSR